MSKQFPVRTIALALAGTSLLAGCWGSDTYNQPVNEKPAFLGAVTMTAYDGNSDDLLTAGMGKTGLGAAAAPAPANPAAPTAAELRRTTFFNNYRAILDISPKGGYGTLYGPNVDINGNVTASEGKIAGNEYLAYADDGAGTQNVTLMVQIPTSFNAAKPCIVTATSSGSRGVYGAIGSAGEWGLKHGCVVAYSDKGTGSGAHDLATDTINLQNGLRTTAAAAGKASNFTASLTAAELAAYNAASPNRVAYKHTHSQQNPEATWGRDTLNAVRMAYYVLNEERGDRNANGTTAPTFKPGNTIVIASSVSNGGGAALAAAEQDTEGLISGVAVAEPQMQLQPGGNLVVKRGSVTTNGTGRPLYDYATLGNLYQPCAALAPAAAAAPGLAIFISVPTATARCASLKDKGLLTATTTTAQATEALDVLAQAGYQPESTPLHATQYGALVTPAIANAYSNAYGRFRVIDALCGLSFAGVDATGKPAPLAAASLAQIFGTSSGVPPSGGLQIINDKNPAGPVNSQISTSPSTGRVDYNVDAALCQRALWTGTDTNAAKVQQGVKEVYRTANLRGKPAIIVHGRADTNVPVSFSVRPYYGLNKSVEGASSKLSYIEVTNAQHFDTFIDNAFFPGFDSMFVPLHYYFIQAMDKMYAHLTTNAALPPAQVLRTVPRGGTPGAAPTITSANVPPILQTPATSDLITFSGNTLTIPD